MKHAFSYWKRRGVPFKKPSIPFGNFKDTFLGKKSIGELFQRFYEESTEPFVGIYSLTQPILFVRDPKIIKDILIKDFPSFNNRGWHANVDVDPMSDNLLTMEACTITSVVLEN